MNLGNLKLNTNMSTEPIFKVLNRSDHDYNTKEITDKLRIVYEGFMSGVRYASDNTPDFQNISNEILNLMDHVIYDVMQITNYSLKIAPVNSIENLEETFEFHPGILLVLYGAYVQVLVSGSDEFLEKISAQAIGDLEQALFKYFEPDEDKVYTEMAKIPEFYNIGMKYHVVVNKQAAFNNTYTVFIEEDKEAKESAK